MKKTIMKTLSVMLAVVLTLTSAPLSGFIGIELPEWFDFSIKSSAATSSGACGENVSFNFNSSTGTLTISGTGEMKNYILSDDRPWASYEDNIKKVIINNGVTSISKYAFYSCNNLTSVTIPDSVATIGDYAFFVCDSLTSITIPDNVTKIGDYAFYNCDSLTSVTIPDSVTTIGKEAFYSCESITKITIGDSVRTIGKEAFYNCAGITSITIPASVTSIGSNAFCICSNLTEILVEENNRYYSNDEYGVLFNKDKTTLIQYPNGNTRACYTFPASVTSIGDSAFRWCTNLTSITINDGVKTIGDSAFCDCRSLTSVTIPESVTYIGGHAFAYCFKLTSITIPDNVTTISTCAFLWCSNLTSVSIGKNVTNIGGNAFQDCQNLTSITMPDTVTEIGVLAFSGCSRLKNITIPNSVTKIIYAAFKDCYSLTDVYYGGSENEWNEITIGNSNEPLLNATKHYARENNPTGTCGDNLTWEFDLYTGTLTISGAGEMYFYYCINTGSEIPWNAYKDDIKTVIIDNGVTEIGYYAFYRCENITSVTIPDSVTTIRYWAFASCDSLTNVTIPASVTSIGEHAFSYCDSLTELIVDEDNQYYSSDEFGVLFDKDKTTLIKYPQGNIRTSYTIPNGVTTIDEYAFSFCKNLINVTIPDTVIKIGDNAFRDCVRLTDIIIPNSVTRIGDEAFDGCDSLTTVRIPASVTSIGDNAFLFCNKLAEIIVDENNQYYSSDEYGVLFNKDKTTLIKYPEDNTRTSYIIPDGVTKIDDNAFYFCHNIATVIVPSSVTEIESGPFTGCNELTQIIVDENNQYYSNDEYGVLFNKEKKAVIRYPEGKTETSYTISNGVTTIADYAFSGCDNLTSVTIPESVTTIGRNAFFLSYSFKEAYYYGTEEEWNEIDIEEIRNSSLVNATIHYNYIDPNKFTGIKGDYFYWNDVRLKAYQLVEFEGDYYFINDGHKIAKNKRIYLSERFVEGTDLKVGYYDFDAEGKMILLNGPVGDYFYKDNVRLKAYQLVEFEGNYYFINDGHKIAKNKRIYLSQRFVEGTDLKVGYYEFDSEGKMVYLNGPVGDYFYKDNVRQKAYQLVEFEGNYYFINDSHKLAKNKRIYLSERFVEGTDLKVGYYEFDSEGKMVYLNGPVGDYFYKDNVRLSAYQLVEFEGEFYFVYNSHKLAKNKRIYLSERFVEGTDLEVGYYNFDADGKMIIE